MKWYSKELMKCGDCKYNSLWCMICEQTGAEVIETSPPGVRVPPPGTVQQRAAPPPFYMSHHQLQMLQYLQEQSSVSLTPQQQVSISYLHLMAFITVLLGLIWVLWTLQIRTFLFFQVSSSMSYSCMLIFFSCVCLFLKEYKCYGELRQCIICETSTDIHVCCRPYTKICWTYLFLNCIYLW